MIPRAKRIRNAVERTEVTHATPSFTTIDIDTLLTNAICFVVCFSIALTILICWTFYYIDIHGGWRRSNCWITQFMHFISGDSIIVCGVTLCALRIIWHARGSVQDFFLEANKWFVYVMCRDMFGTQLKYQIKCNRHFFVENIEKSIPFFYYGKKESKGTKKDKGKNQEKMNENCENELI